MSIQRLPESRPAVANSRAKAPGGSRAKSSASFEEALARGKKKPLRDHSLDRGPQEAGDPGEVRPRNAHEIELPILTASQAGMELPAGSVAQVAAAVTPGEGAAAASGTALVGADQQMLDRLVQQVVTAARTLDGGRGHHLQVSLNLGALGQAEVELRKNAEGAIDLLFRGEDAAAEGELKRGLVELRRRLLNRGLRPGRLEVGGNSEARR